MNQTTEAKRGQTCRTVMGTARFIGVFGVALIGSALGLASGCRERTAPPDSDETQQAAPQEPAGPVVLLTGAVASVAKSARGRAEIVRHGNQFELRLHGVRVESNQPVRVYLVGVESAPTTRSVTDTELQYDMAELDQTATEQVIALPSEPDPALRSVVLWEPVFRINLASATLTPPGKQHAD